MSLKYKDHPKVKIPLSLLKDLAEIAFDYANPEGAKYHGLPLTAKQIALNAGNTASEIIRKNQENFQEVIGSINFEDGTVLKSSDRTDNSVLYQVIKDNVVIGQRRISIEVESHLYRAGDEKESLKERVKKFKDELISLKTNNKQ